jgi:hypothetical protein
VSPDAAADPHPPLLPARTRTDRTHDLRSTSAGSYQLGEELVYRAFTT